MENVVEIDARASIERQASRWLIRMDGDEPLTEGEQEALREWMSRSPLHRDALRRLSRFWNQANILSGLIAAFEAERREHKRRRGASWIRTILMGAAVLASVILIYCGLQQSRGPVTVTYETVVGQQKTIRLSDASSIQLNTNSEVRVAYDSHSRRIRLTKGEALFSVTPDSNKAFEVYVADSIVRAVGTAFAIRVDGRMVDITVAKGVVDVSDASSSIGRVRAGEVTSFRSGNGRMEVHQLSEPELLRRMAWREGYLAFSGEPLSEVIAQLNRYSTTTLAIGDPELASIAIGGRFRIGDVDAVVNLLSTTFRIRAHQVDDHTIRLDSERAR